jgi:hypothetical protein
MAASRARGTGAQRSRGRPTTRSSAWQVGAADGRGRLWAGTSAVGALRAGRCLPSMTLTLRRPPLPLPQASSASTGSSSDPAAPMWRRPSGPAAGRPAPIVATQAWADLPGPPPAAAHARARRRPRLPASPQFLPRAARPAQGRPPRAPAPPPAARGRLHRVRHCFALPRRPARGPGLPPLSKAGQLTVGAAARAGARRRRPARARGRAKAKAAATAGGGAARGARVGARVGCLGDFQGQKSLGGALRGRAAWGMAI